MEKISPTILSDSSFDAYVKYLALKKHFTTDGYDFFKYNGKVRASYETFMSRNDAYFFAKLTKRDDWLNLILSNVIIKPDIWIREILEEEAQNRYIEWKRKQDSLSHVFKSELVHLLDDYQQNFVSRDGQHPYIMTMYSQKKISLETFTILSHQAKVFSYWSEKIVDKIVSCDIIRLSKKYKPFLDYDEKKFKSIIRGYFF